MSTSSAHPITQRVSQKMKKKGQTSANDDPTEGDGRRWAQGSKYSFLSGRLHRWGDARALGEMSTFYSRITLLFIRHFSWEHALDVDGTGPPGEPSEENLDAVLDVTGLAPEEISRRNLVYLELRGKLQRWFRYHGTKSLKLHKPDNSLAKIIKAFGTQAKPPRRMQTIQFYSKLYYEARVKAVVDAEWPTVVAQAGVRGAPPPKRLKHQNAVLSRIYATETPQFQQALTAQRDAEYHEELAAWKASRLDFGHTSKSAEEYHEALVEASHWLPGFAEAMSKHLGLNIAVLLTGPMGSNGGRIEVKATHAGKSHGITPKIWPDYDPQSYTALLKALVAFGNASFSEEECRRRALPDTTPNIQEDGDGDLTETSSRPSSPGSSHTAVSRPLPPVLAAVLDTAKLGKKGAAGQAKPTGIPAMPPPVHMRRIGNGTGAISGLGAATAEVAGGKVRAPPMIIPSVSTTTSTPSSPPPASETLSGATSRAPSPSSTTSSTSSLIVLPPPPTTSQTSSLPPKDSAAPATYPPKPKPRPQRKQTVTASASSSASSSVLSTVVSPTSPTSPAPTSRVATSPPLSTSEPSGTSLAPSSPITSSTRPDVLPHELPSSPSMSLDGSAARTSLQSGPLSRVDVKHCTPEIERVVQYLMNHGDWTPMWEHCVATFVEIERYADFKPRGSLVSSTDGRPREVAAWMKRARKLVDFPINDVDKFAEAWLCWWANNLPEGYRDDDTEASDVDWSDLYVCGPNGLRLFLLTLAWWGHVLEDDDSEERGVIWADALSSIKVALDNVLLAAAALGGDEADDADVDVKVPAVQSRKRRRGGTISSSSSTVKKAKRGGK